jgi:aubergine
MFRLEVWPGYVTSILQFENSTMLIADVTHKVVHGATVLDVMLDISTRYKATFKERCAKSLIGQTVLTR